LPIRRCSAALALLLIPLAGCTRVVDDARPVPQRSVGPITAGQVSDLLSDKAEEDTEPNLFVTVDPERCAGLAREVDAPFVFEIATPAAHDGGHSYTDDQKHSVQEIVAVYPSDYDAAAAVNDVTRTVADCRDAPLAVTTMEQETLHFQPTPAADSGVPEIVLWSLGGASWACDNAFVAAHNAAVEITACGQTNGADVLALAEDALKRIEKLANATL
jgi:hypothetical protein